MAKKLKFNKKKIREEVINKKDFPKTYNLLEDLKELISDTEDYLWG